MVSASPGPAPGRAQAGAGGMLTGLDGCGGMFEGSEGPERAVAGRYEGRQTGQVPSALFWHFFTFRRFHFCVVLRGGAGRRPFLDTSYSERIHAHPEGGDLAGSGAITAALGHYLREHPLPHGIRTSFSMGWPWHRRAPSSHRRRAGRATVGTRRRVAFRVAIPVARLGRRRRHDPSSPGWTVSGCG